MNTGIRILPLSVAAILSLGGCNNDIFVDDLELPDRSAVSMAGNDGQWSVPVDGNDLLRYSVCFEGDELEFVTCYAEGAEVVDMDSPEVREISFETPAASFSVSRSRDMLYVTSRYNAYPVPVTRHITLYFREAEKNIDVTFLPCCPLESVLTSYYPLAREEEFVRQESHTVVFENNGSASSVLTLNPFQDATASVEIVPRTEWGRGLKADMELLVFDGYNWNVCPAEEVITGVPRSLKISYDDMEEYVVAPPHSKVIVRYAVSYARESAHGVQAFYNVTSGLYSELDFDCVSIFPVSYEISVEYE